ncbi:MAG: hypothetical protein U0X92_09415 [Anaerolineales bacterium]
MPTPSTRRTLSNADSTPRSPPRWRGRTLGHRRNGSGRDGLVRANGLDNELAKCPSSTRGVIGRCGISRVVEIINTVMDTNRNYLASKHTLKHLRAGEMALTKLAERNSWILGRKMDASKWQITRPMKWSDLARTRRPAVGTATRSGVG